jgi:hypothetical protein
MINALTAHDYHTPQGAVTDEYRAMVTRSLAEKNIRKPGEEPVSKGSLGISREIGA